jgi:acyl carrier protein
VFVKQAEDGSVTRDELKQQLKALLIEGLRLETTRPEDIRDAEPIFVEGLGLDSIDALELAVLVEEQYRVSIPDEEVGKVAFASIDALADYILGHQGAGSA